MTPARNLRPGMLASHDQSAPPRRVIRALPTTYNGRPCIVVVQADGDGEAHHYTAPDHTWWVRTQPQEEATCT